MTDLETVLAIRSQMRDDAESRLRAAGLTWTKLDELEQKVIDQIPPEGIKAHGYTFTVETRVNHLDKVLEERADVQIVERRGAGVSKRISLHK